MGSWPLARPLFYQYKSTNEQAKGLLRKASDQAHAGVAPSGYLISSSPKLILPVMTTTPSMPAQPREATCSDQHSRSITCGPDEQRHRSRGRGIWPFPQRRTAEGGGGCLTTATAQPWQVQDGRRRPQHLVALAQPQGTPRNSSSSTPRWMPFLFTASLQRPAVHSSHHGLPDAAPRCSPGAGPED